MFYEVLGDEPVGPQKKSAVNKILEENKDQKNVIFTSIIAHVEILPKKLTDKNTDDEKQYLSLFDGKHFADIEISRNILVRAREIRDFYYKAADSEGKGCKIMDAADALHLATASIYEADEFHTRDNDKKSTKIPLVDLYQWSGTEQLCGKYPLKIISPEDDEPGFDFDGETKSG